MDTSLGLQKALQAAGSQSALARALGITAQSVQQWKRVPAERLVEIERVTGISRADLRPDIFAGYGKCCKKGRK